MNKEKFIKYLLKNQTEFRKVENEYVFYIPIYEIQEFCKIFSHRDFDDDNIKCIMKDGYFVFTDKNLNIDFKESDLFY